MRSLHDRAGIRDIALDTAVHGHSDSKCCKTSGRKAHGGETKEEEPLFGLLRRTQMLANGHVGKPLLMWVAILIYGVCTTLWWLGGSFRGDNCETLDGSSPQAAVDPRTLDSSLIDPQSIHVPKLTCLGWRETSTCAGIQNFLPVETNRSCDAPIIGGMASGYCMMLDEATGEEVQAFSVNCSSVMLGQRFRCRQAADIAKTSAELERAIAQAKWNNAIETQNQATLRRMDELQTPTSGIVMVVYPKLLVSVHATIRLLRTVHKCALPIEVWYLKSEMMRGSTVPVETQPVLQSLVNDYGPTTLRQIRDSRARGFYAKIYALLNSKFDQVLFLDADNMPVRDPAFLFTESKAFQATGAVFWPDFWLPPHTIFNIHEQSVLWEVIGMPFVDMFEQESGQVLIDKRRAKASGALAALEYLAFYRPNYIAGMQMAYGDKDLFRLAWMKAGAQFHMVPHPPATAGSTFEGVEGTVFCGMTMVQFDPDASANAGPEAILFMHRNSKKLTGEEEEDKDVVWTHVQVFKYPEEAMATPAMQYEHARKFYRIEYGGMSDVAKIVRCNQCYGDRNLKSPYFQLTPVDEVGASWHIRDLETSLLRFGREAMELHTQLQPS